MEVVLEYLENYDEPIVAVYEYSYGEIGQQLEVCSEVEAYNIYDVVGEITHGKIRIKDD